MDRPWHPSNSSDGMWFESEFCDKCARERWNPETGKGQQCSILNKVLLGGQPDELQYSDDDKPTCTAFKLPEPRKKPEPKIPGQLTF